MRLPRLFCWLIASILLLVVIALFYPQQLGVVVFKVLLVSVAGKAGYWLDRSLFPYARPDGYLAHKLENRYDRDPVAHDADYLVVEGYHTVFAAAMIRRAIIVGCAMLAVGLGA